MKSLTTPDFWTAYQVLPQSVRNLARKTYRLWQENPNHPSLHLEKGYYALADCLVLASAHFEPKPMMNLPRTQSFLNRTK